MVIDLPRQQDSLIKSQIRNFENQLLSRSSIVDYTFSNSVIGDWEKGTSDLKRNDRSEAFTIGANNVGSSFIPFYGIKLIAGRNFLPNHPEDENTIILSRKAILTLGFKNPEEALGAQILVPQVISVTSDYRSSTVIGVIEDYFQSPFFTDNNTLGLSLVSRTLDVTMWKASLRIFPGQFNKALSQLQADYAAGFPNAVFNWYFLEDHVSRHYDGEKIVSNQIILFTLIAIGIACLGLLGMISNKVVEKIKEIGIRKVLGARLHHLGSVLLGSSLKQLAIAMFLGLPVAWYLTQQYLEKYSERITLQWWHFALPVLILVLILFATIASVLLKAAKSNPVEALKYE